MPRARLVILLSIFLLCCLVTATIVLVPPLNERHAWRVENAWFGLKRRMDNAWVGLLRLFNPPEQVVFVPGQGQGPGAVETSVELTIEALSSTAVSHPGDTATPQPTSSGVGAPTLTLLPSVTASPTVPPTPLPASVLLTGLTHEPQQFNNCGPASLSMALSFWKWQGSQNDTRAFLRPNREMDDKNVNPAEMVTFVENQAGLNAVTRVGGDLQTLKRFLAAGFPLLIEEGHDPLDDWWMGHYLVINGYDDRSSQFTTQDSLLGSPDALVPYDQLLDHWRDFNNVYLVIYPPERQAEIDSLLGAPLDEAVAFRTAAERAQAETSSLSGRANFFAWFNLGSNLVGLQEYDLAAQAFDKAFEIYAGLPEDKTDPDSRPFRLMWYRFGPYEAYFHTGRYQDVVDLADTTFTWVGRPVLEESYYWRALAYEALGQVNLAISDLQKALNINPNFSAAQAALDRLVETAGNG